MFLFRLWVMLRRKEKFFLRICNYSFVYRRVGNLNVYYLCGFRNFKLRNKMVFYYWFFGLFGRCV